MQSEQEIREGLDEAREQLRKSALKVIERLDKDDNEEAFAEACTMGFIATAGIAIIEVLK